MPRRVAHMSSQHRSGRLLKPGTPFLLLLAFLAVIWLAGGASRADVLGQAVVRGAAWIALILVVLLGVRPRFKDARPVVMLLLGAVVLTLLQLVPLPPDIWQAAPGRALLAEAASASGQDQPWRPWSIVPGATANAAASLVVPFTVLVLVVSLSERERSWLPGVLLGLIAVSALIGLLQFSGINFNNLFANDQPGQVSGTFANRNHFALLLACGCMLAPVWAFLDGRKAEWRGPVAFGLVLLFVLTILASGSRTGLLLGVLAVGIGLILVRRGIRKALSRYPRWVFPALVVAIVGVIAIFVLISLAAGRAVSIERALELNAGEDPRGRALPTVLNIVRFYFPAGSGLGGFDPVFRIHEPFELLKLTYLNHAHNDFLEVALDAGLPGIILVLAAMMWWGLASVRAWRAGSSVRDAVPKLGSATLLLVFIASVFDYPARTPIIMAMLIMAGVWLNRPVEERPEPALPTRG